MKKFNLYRVLTLVMLFISLTSSPISYADASADQGAQFSRDELEEMLAPVALYPDALLSQLLMAATYPLEVVEAARWSAAHSDLTGDDAVREVADRNWDPSVKSLVAFPRILSEMSEKLDWTERLGDAFLGQQEQVTDTVQELRQKAYDAGNLRSSEQINVSQEGQTIAITDENPEVAYVPYYNPEVIYGPWWGAAPPVFWDPWVGYAYRPGYSDGFAWGVGVTLAAGFFFGGFDWGHHYAIVGHANNYYFNNDHYSSHYGNHEGSQPWQFDSSHRRGVPYHNRQLRQQYGRSSAAADEHRNYRGRDVPLVANHRSDHVSSDRNDKSSHALRAPAFEDMSRGSAVHDDSNRGRSSRQQMIAQPRSAPVGKSAPNRATHSLGHQR